MGICDKPALLNVVHYGDCLCTPTAHDKMRTGADLNADNLRISSAYLRISDHCSVGYG